MTIWIARIEWNYNPTSGLPQQAYTVLMPNRRGAVQRVKQCINVVTGADPNLATFDSCKHTARSSEASLTLAGERIEYTIHEHEGSIREPGLKIKEESPA